MCRLVIDNSPHKHTYLGLYTRGTNPNLLLAYITGH